MEVWNDELYPKGGRILDWFDVVVKNLITHFFYNSVTIQRRICHGYDTSLLLV